MVRSGAGGAFVFLCPSCDESLEVNGRMKDTLLAEGCVICGSRVTASAFTSVGPTDPC